MNYLKHKISKDELIKIFKNNIDRNIFIGEYQNFKNDDNDIFYQDFIDLNLSKHGRKIQEDAIELSMAVNIYEESYLNEIKKILHSRRQGIIKLVCLDWLFFFYQRIPKKDFIDLNEYVLKHMEYDLLKIQAVLNILLFKYTDQLISVLITCFNHSNDPAIFYRLNNALTNHELAKSFTNSTIYLIIDVINLNGSISKNQKNEIIDRLRQFALRRVDNRQEY